MRSAEQSGVGMKGFGLSTGRTRATPNPLGRLFRNVSAFIAEISPVTFAVALTALLAASLWVIADVARTSSEAKARQDLLMSIAASEPAATWRYAGSVMTTLAGPADGDAATLSVLHRGLGAFGIALAVTAFAFRFRRKPVSADIRRYESLLATIPFGVACWTASGRLVVCNDQYRARLNEEAPELRAGVPYQVAVKRLQRNGEIVPVSEDENNRLLELRRDDGTCLLIDERPLAGGGFVTLLSDITERRRTDDLLATIREEQRQLARRYHEEKLRAEAASRSKTSFLAHLSHDIRTPLNHIIGFAEMMRQETYGPLGDKRYLDYVDGMRDSGERLLSFFASTLELAQLESGQKLLQQEPFEVDSLMQSVARRFSGQAQRARVSLTLAPPCGARLVGDAFSLERMAGNIVENALRFTPAGGRVTLAAYAAADGVVLEITDTGIGMSEERLASLSQPFAFGDAALTRQHTGAGLGIAIARTIAELSGGRLAIDSRPALGTTVAISLPLPAAQFDVRAA